MLIKNNNKKRRSKDIIMQFIKLAIVLLSLLSHGFVRSQTHIPDVFVSTNFLEACTNGDINVLQRLLDAHPEWIHGRSSDGETCLHVAGIYGQSQVTRLILERGGDPNVRTTFAQGLRMHPLSWNVYGGHVETARELLRHGANVNLDVDDMKDSSQRVTVLDIILDILSTKTDNNQAQENDSYLAKYMDMKDMLLQYGAKQYKELIYQER